MTPGEFNEGNRFADRQASELIRLREVEKELRNEVSLANAYLHAEKSRNKLLEERLVQVHAKVRQADEAGKRALTALKEQETLILELQEEIERYRLREQLR